MKKTTFTLMIISLFLLHFMCKEKSHTVSNEDDLKLMKDDSTCFVNIKDKTWIKVSSTDSKSLSDTFQIQFLANSGLFIDKDATYSCSAIYHYNESIKTVHFKCSEIERLRYHITYCDSDSLRVHIYENTSRDPNRLNMVKTEECSFKLVLGNR